MRSAELPHRATYVLVFNSAGQLFVHKQTTTKVIYAGCYERAAGGVVLGSKSYEQGAYLELKEELGISGIPFEVQFDFFFEEPNLVVLGRLFSCTYDGPLKLQAEEVERGSFMSIPDVLVLA